VRERETNGSDSSASSMISEELPKENISQQQKRGVMETLFIVGDNTNPIHSSFQSTCQTSKPNCLTNNQYFGPKDLSVPTTAQYNQRLSWYPTSKSNRSIKFGYQEV